MAPRSISARVGRSDSSAGATRGRKIKVFSGDRTTARGALLPYPPVSRRSAFPAARLRRLPAHERSRATVDAILDATARVLVRDGYDKTTTNRVAEVAGVSIGTLYQYFESKEAIVVELGRRHADRMSATIAAKLGALIDAPLEVVARALVQTMIEAHALEPELHRALIEGAARAGDHARLREVEDGLW